MADEHSPLDAILARAEMLRDSQGSRALEPWLPYTVLIPGAVAQGAPDAPSAEDEPPLDNDYSGWSHSLDSTPAPAEPEPVAGPVPSVTGFRIDPNADLPDWLRAQQEQAQASTPPVSAAPTSSAPWQQSGSAPLLPEVSVDESSTDATRAAGRVSVPRPDENVG